MNLMRAVTPSTGGRVQRVVDGAVEGLGVGLGRAVERGLGDPRAGGHGDEHGGDRHQAAGGCGAKSSHCVPVLRADFESSLTTSVKRAPSTSTRPPWRSAIARTIARPRPGALAARLRAAVEALEDPASGSSGPGPSSSTRMNASLAVAADGHGDRAAAVLVRVADEVADGALERGALALGPDVALDHDVARRGPRAGRARPAAAPRRPRGPAPAGRRAARRAASAPACDVGDRRPGRAPCLAR